MRGIVAQARALLVGQLAVMSFAVVDTVLTGHASAVDLATLGLGLSVYSTVFVGLYTNDSAVAAMALSLLPYLAAFHFFDAIQAVVGFVLRAHKIVVPPTVIYAVTLWGMGVFGGYQLAFRGVAGPPWGIAGTWLLRTLAGRHPVPAAAGN